MYGMKKKLNEIAFHMFEEIYYQLYNGAQLEEITLSRETVEDPTKVILKRKY